MSFKKGELSKGGKVQGLTNKQKLFLAEYKRDCNGERAATAAGYRHPKISAHQMLDGETFPLVAVEMKKMMEEKSAQSGIDAAWIVKKLTTLAAYNPKHYYNKDGSCKGIHELSDEAAYAIQSVETRTKTTKDEETGEVTTVTRVVGYKLEPRLEALKQLAQHLGKLIDHVQVNNTVVLNFDSIMQQLGPRPVEDPIEVLIERAGEQ